MWSSLLSTIVFAPFVSAIAVATLVEAPPSLDPGDDDPPRAERSRDRARSASQVFDAADIDRVHIDLHAGDVRLSPSDSGRVAVELDELRVDDRCHVRVEPDGRTLEIVARVDGFPGRRCEVDLDVALPPDLAVDAEVGAGDVDLDGVDVDLSLELGAGDVRGSIHGDRVQVHTGAGDIRLDELVSAMSAHSGAGAVSLDFVVAPEGRIQARTGVGDVDVTLPSQTAVDADASTGLGTVRQELVQRAGAATVVEARTGLGDVELSGD